MSSGMTAVLSCYPHSARGVRGQSIWVCLSDCVTQKLLLRLTRFCLHKESSIHAENMSPQSSHSSRHLTDDVVDIGDHSSVT